DNGDGTAVSLFQYDLFEARRNACLGPFHFVDLNAAAFASMNEKGTPDIASEYWINSVRALLDQAVNSGRLVQGAEIMA
ncbi:hypothetical protein ACC736_39560, partial [Rhizobium ruizarguesonis]